MTVNAHTQAMPSRLARLCANQDDSAIALLQRCLMGKQEVTGLLPSGQAPLLVPNPLRTGLEGFPSSGSSTQKRPPEKRGRGLIQKQIRPTRY
jgi:hypothetical protein